MSDGAAKRDVALMARHLTSGYYSFLVAHHVAVNPQSINSLSSAHPIGEIKRKDGTVHSLDLRCYLDLLREDQSLQRNFLRLWAMGALLTLGDELTKHRYFDQAPILELVYHLRNGIAHGNQFRIDSRGEQRLVKHPAHNRHAAKKSPLGTLHEIVPSLTGRVLFDFIGAADVIDLLQSVEDYLLRWLLHEAPVALNVGGYAALRISTQ
jgi:hypothetical protein